MPGDCTCAAPAGVVEIDELEALVFGVENDDKDEADASPEKEEVLLLTSAARREWSAASGGELPFLIAALTLSE